MKYCCAALLLLWTSLFAAAPAHTAFELDIADLLARDGIIVDQSSNPANYRLDSTMSRQEAVGVTLRMADIELPEKYFCRNYFRDVAYDPINNWVCRAIEIGADQGIISRANALAHPASTITRIEALAIIMQAQRITYPRNIARSGYPATMPQWQVDLLSAALSQKIIGSTSDFSPDAPATRMDVFGLIYNMLYAGKSSAWISPNYEQGAPLQSASEESVTSANPAALAAFSITTVPETVTAGKPFEMMIVALDAKGKVIPNYTGTFYIDVIQWDASKTPFSPEENNSYSIRSGEGIAMQDLIFRTPGDYTLDIYEIESGKDITTTFTLTVKGGTGILTDFVITAPKEVTVNTPFDLTITALEGTGKTFANYQGEFYLDSNQDMSNVIFPDSNWEWGGYKFAEDDQGTHTFTKGVTLKKPGTYELIVFELDGPNGGIEKVVTITATN